MERFGLITGARRLLTKPSYAFLAASMTVFGIGGYAVFAFSAPFLIRVQGMTATQAGLTLGLINGAAGVVGALAGGYLTDRLARRDQRNPLFLAAAALVLAAPLLIAGFLAPSARMSFALLTLPALLAALYAAPCFATAQALAPPGAHAAASAIPLLGQSLIGASLGPLLVGVISDHLAPSLGTQSLRYALCILSLSYVASAALLLAATIRLRRDLTEVSGRAA